MTCPSWLPPVAIIAAVLAGVMALGYLLGAAQFLRKFTFRRVPVERTVEVWSVERRKDPLRFKVTHLLLLICALAALALVLAYVQGWVTID